MCHDKWRDSARLELTGVEARQLGPRHKNNTQYIMYNSLRDLHFILLYIVVSISTYI